MTGGSFKTKGAVSTSSLLGPERPTSASKGGGLAIALEGLNRSRV